MDLHALFDQARVLDRTVSTSSLALGQLTDDQRLVLLREATVVANRFTAGSDPAKIRRLSSQDRTTFMLFTQQLQRQSVRLLALIRRVPTQEEGRAFINTFSGSVDQVLEFLEERSRRPGAPRRAPRARRRPPTTTLVTEEERPGLPRGLVIGIIAAAGVGLFLLFRRRR